MTQNDAQNRPVPEIPPFRGEPALRDVAIVAAWRVGPSGPEVLLTRRPGHVHLGGLWELPGGKVEPSETPIAAAARELLEETRLIVAESDLVPLATAMHDYADRSVRLHAFAVRVPPDATVECVEHAWTPLTSLRLVKFPAANRPITDALVAFLAALPAAQRHHQPGRPECGL